MKEVFYYEFSDDGKDWVFGDCAKSLISCLDKARKCPYRVRVKRARLSDHVVVGKKRIQESLEELQLLDQIFEEIKI